MPVVVPLAAIATCALLIALSLGYRYTIGAVLSKLADLFIAATWKGPFGISIGLKVVGEAIDDLDNSIRDAFADGIAATEWAWHTMVHQLAELAEDVGHTIERQGLDVYQAMKWLRKHALPVAIAASLGPWLPLIRLLEAKVKELEKVPAHVVERIERVVGAQPVKLTLNEVTKVRKVFESGAAAIPLPFPTPWPRIRDLGKQLDELADRLKGNTKKLTAAGIAGLVAAAAFAHLKLGWLQCSNVQRVGKLLCGLDRDLLEGLLAGLVIVIGTVSLRDFASTLHPAAGDGGDRDLGAAAAAGGHAQGPIAAAASETRTLWRSAATGQGGNRALGAASA